MVERTEIVREARRTAQQIVDDAERQARRDSGSRPRTTSTASSPRSRSCSSARCRRWRRVASSSRSASIRSTSSKNPTTCDDEGGFFDQDELGLIRDGDCYA